MDIVSYLLGRNSNGSAPAILQEKSAGPSQVEQLITPDEGYNGLSQVTISAAELEAKSVSPSTSQVDVTPGDDKYGLSSVTVAAVTSSIDANIAAGNIKKGVTILGVTGTYGSDVVPPEAGTLTGIIIGSLPTKISYTEGDALDLSGCVIMGTYSNGFNYDVTMDCTFVCNNPVTYYDTKIVVQYQGFTLDIPITVAGAPVLAPAQTQLLCHFNSSLRDEVSGNNCNAGGAAYYDGKFDKALSFNSGTDGVFHTYYTFKTTPNSLCHDQWTIEFWAKTNSSNYALFCPFSIGRTVASGSGVSSYSSSSLIGNKYGENNLKLNVAPLTLNPSSYSSYTDYYIDTNYTCLNAWHHFAIVFDGGTATTFLDGHKARQGQIGNYIYIGDSYSSTATTQIGLCFSQGSNKVAFIDELMITKSVKYVADFDPPHGEYYLQGGE